MARLDRVVNVQVPEVLGLFASSAAPVSAGSDIPSKRSGLLGQALQSPPGFALPGGGVGLLATLLIGFLAIVGLVALARLVVGEELFEVGHWPGHRN
jgi:hypothetical protein